MSDYGFAIKSAMGTMLVDAEHSHLVKSESGTTTVTAAAPNPVEISFAETYTSANIPLVAMRRRWDLSNAINQKGLVLAAGEYTSFKVAFSTLAGNPSVTHPLYIDWVAFVPITDDLEISGDYGINVYDSAGNFVWSSDAKETMKLNAIYFWYTYPPGTTYRYTDPNYPTSNFYYIYNYPMGGEPMAMWEVFY